MAKTKPTVESTAEEFEHDELRRQLGFDELTYEECFRELFGDLFELSPRSADGATRVTQMGPGRRNSPKAKPKPKTKPKEK